MESWPIFISGTRIFAIALHHLPQIARERIQIAQVNVANAMMPAARCVFKAA